MTDRPTDETDAGPDDGAPTGDGEDTFSLPGLGATAEALESGDEPRSAPPAEPVESPGESLTEAADESVEPTAADEPATTTAQYQDLAAEVRAADEAGPLEQHVSVHVAGLGTGVASFSDIAEGSGVVSTAAAAPDETTERILSELEAEESDRAQLRLRIITAAAIVGSLAIAAWAGAVWLTALVGLIAFLAIGEFFAASRRAGYAPVAIVGLLGIIGAFVAGYRNGAYGIAGVLLLAILATLLLYAVAPRRDPMSNAAVTVLGLAWVGLLAFVAPLTRADGWEQLVALVVITIAAVDVGGYFVGRSLGKTALAPGLSPGKTVEGLAGGIVLGFAVALGLSQLPWMSDVVTIPIGLAVAAVAGLLGPLGDLGASAIKRSFGIKDMGSILPGHGGVIDRIDSFLLTLPGVIVVFLWLDAIP